MEPRDVGRWLCAAGIALVLVGAFSHHWIDIPRGEDSASVSAGLLEVTACERGGCFSAGYGFGDTGNLPVGLLSKVALLGTLAVVIAGGMFLYESLAGRPGRWSRYAVTLGAAGAAGAVAAVIVMLYGVAHLGALWHWREKEGGVPHGSVGWSGFVYLAGAVAIAAGASVAGRSSAARVDQPT